MQNGGNTAVMTSSIFPNTQFHQNWLVRKPPAAGDEGVVACQHRAAAEVGAEVLRAGGNAVDAAIAVSFAIAAVEPWMSGIGGSFTARHESRSKKYRDAKARQQLHGRS